MGICKRLQIMCFTGVCLNRRELGTPIMNIKTNLLWDSEVGPLNALGILKAPFLPNIIYHGGPSEFTTSATESICFRPVIELYKKQNLHRSYWPYLEGIKFWVDYTRTYPCHHNYVRSVGCWKFAFKCDVFEPGLSMLKFLFTIVNLVYLIPFPCPWHPKNAMISVCLLRFLIVLTLSLSVSELSVVTTCKPLQVEYFLLKVLALFFFLSHRWCLGLFY